MSDDDDARVTDLGATAARSSFSAKLAHNALASRVAQLERRLYFAEKRIQILTRALLADDDHDAELQ